MLGQFGLFPDAAPETLPPNAWSRGNNVRFEKNRVSRAPALRTVDQGLLQSSPSFVLSAVSVEGTEYLVIANDDGNLTKWSGGTETDVSPTSGFTPGTDPRAFTGCVLGNVVYVNRPDRVPYGLLPTGTDFEVIPAWDSNLRCGALRSFGDYLLAINVIDSGTDKPQLVKWSDATLINEFPDSFDSTDAEQLAGETPLSALRGPLVDGLSLRNAFILYGRSQAFIMTLSNDQFVFNFDKLFDDGGLIAPNCVVEVDGRHYVFGPSDIYVHDGVTKQSISDGSVKDLVYKNLELDAINSFFVFHDPFRTEVCFCFVSTDDDAYFEPGDKPNRCVAYNYSNQTWAPRDVPNAVGAATVSTETLLTWANATTTWATQGGAWAQTGSGKNRGVVMVKGDDAISAETIFALDAFDIDSRFLFPLFDEAIAPAYVQRTGIDLAELGVSARDYKTWSTIMPIGRMVSDTASIYVKLGSQITPSAEVVWDEAQTFNPITDYKIDTRQGGRFLAIEYGVTDNVDFQLSGYDFDFTANSHR
jgi:hypothetical protein